MHLFGAETVLSLAERLLDQDSSGSGGQARCPSAERLVTAIHALANDKVCGNDRLSGEFLKCALEPIAAKLHELFGRIWHHTYVLVQWRGGKISRLFKKGSPTDCDNYR